MSLIDPQRGRALDAMLGHFRANPEPLTFRGMRRVLDKEIGDIKERTVLSMLYILINTGELKFAPDLSIGPGPEIGVSS